MQVGQLAGAPDRGVGCEDLLDQTGSGTRQTDDEHGANGEVAAGPALVETSGREGRDHPLVELRLAGGIVELPARGSPGRLDLVGLVEECGGLGIEPTAIANDRQAEMQMCSGVARQVRLIDQSLEALLLRIGQAAVLIDGQPPVGFCHFGADCQCRAGRLARELEVAAFGLDPGDRGPGARECRVVLQRRREMRLRLRPAGLLPSARGPARDGPGARAGRIRAPL